MQVVKGNTVETRKVRVGLTSDTSTEILEGLDVGEIVVADVLALQPLHDGDQIKTMFADELIARGHANGFEYLGMVDPKSASFDRLFDHPAGARLGELRLLAVTRLPSADIPVISVVVSQFGAALSELESQVTKPSKTASPASRACGTFHRPSQTACR